MTFRLPLAAALADLVLPAECAVCGAPGADACARCAAPLAAPAHRAIPDPEPPGLVPVWSVAAYEGSVTRLVAAYKEEGRAALADPLGAALAAAVAAALLHAPGAALAGGVVLVPAPSSRSATRRRGRDPTADLARAAARRLRAAGLPVRTVGLLAHTRALADQAGLRADERARNLSGALGVVPRRLQQASPPDATAALVLVDDVLTTGATLHDAGRALRAVGLAPAGAATVAATVRRTSSRRSTWAARSPTGTTTVGTWHPSGSVVASPSSLPPGWVGRD